MSNVYDVHMTWRVRHHSTNYSIVGIPVHRSTLHSAPRK